PSGEGGPNRILLAGIFTSMIEIGIVIYFDDKETFRRFLQVYAVEPVANEAGCVGSHVDHFLWRGRKGNWPKATFDRPLAARIVIDDLPMFACHQIAGHEDWLAPQHADSPVEVGRHELLADQKISLL